MPPLPHEADSDGVVDEILDLQNTAHYSSIPSRQPTISILESINSVLHSAKSNISNGSQTGSAGGLLNTASGQETSEEESDTVVLLALFIPLAITVTAIFIIALFVRKMRRAESMQDVPNNNKNELEMTPRKKISAHSTNSTMSSTSSSTSPHLTPTHSIKGYSSSNKSQQIDNYSSSGSIYRNSSFLRLSSHLQLQYQSSLHTSGTCTSPTGSITPPQWPIYYSRSLYGINKLHQALCQQSSLPTFSSVHNLSESPLSRQNSDPLSYTQSDPEMDGSSDEGNNKKPNKKIKRVLSAMNFPRKIKQYQADRKRFNVYTIPVETREQLKHIYVY